MHRYYLSSYPSLNTNCTINTTRKTALQQRRAEKNKNTSMFLSYQLSKLEELEHSFFFGCFIPFLSFACPSSWLSFASVPELVATRQHGQLKKGNRFARASL